MTYAFTPAFAAAIVALSCLDAAPAGAQSIVTYVSGKGADSGACTPQASPCRSFAYALTQTLPGGEIKALDPDGYGPVTITQAVSIIGVEGAGINRQTGVHIAINAAPSDSVNISNLILDGNHAATNGIVFSTGGSLTIRNCVAQNFTNAGIVLYPSGTANFLLANVVVTGNGSAGIEIESASGSSTFVLDHVVASYNGAGVSMTVVGSVSVTAVDSIASSNGGNGFNVSGGTLLLSQSTATQNGGYGAACGGTCQTAGNNFFFGNGFGKYSGTLVNEGAD